MNQESLLGQFLSENCDPFIDGKLLKEIEELYESDVSREHAFNRFNVRLDYGSDRIRIMQRRRKRCKESHSKSASA